jgi:Glycosyltransferase family 87
VSAGATPAAPGHDHALRRERLVWLASVALCGVLPAVTVAALFVSTIQDDAVAFDFRPFYRAAGSILGGTTPYPGADVPLTAESGAYVYPPLGGLLAIPLHPLPLEVAGLTVMALLVAAAAAVPFVLGVRDWRCYGLLFLWPPVLSAIQTGNVTLWFALAAAVAWRFRDRMFPPSVSLGATLAAKFFLWPLVVWLAATRRVRSAIVTVAIGFSLLLATWATIGFAGLLEYPDLLRRLERTIGEDSYTLRIVLLDAGVPATAARAGWLLLGVLLVVGVAVVGRRGDDAGSFILAIAAALALTPIVWLHYFALLLVIVAIAQPSLGILWFVPLGMVVTPGSGHPAPWQTAWTLVVAAVTIGWALWLVRRDGRDLVPLRTAPQPS